MLDATSDSSNLFDAGKHESVPEKHFLYMCSTCHTFSNLMSILSHEVQESHFNQKNLKILKYTVPEIPAIYNWKNLLRFSQKRIDAI